MAQLRDAKTSELIAEGTPLEVAVLALELGEREVLFDDVGADFNPRAVIDAGKEHADGLAGAAKVAKGDERKRLEELAKEAKAELTPAADAVADAERELEAARANLKG